MRKPWHPAVEWLHLPLGILLFFVALPVAFPVAMIQHGLTERRKRRQADRTPCARCGVILGQVALEKADAAWREHWEEMARRYPGHRFRMVRKVWAVCPACGQAYGYDEAADAFIPAPPRDE